MGTVNKDELRQHAKFGQNTSNSGGDVAIFNFFSDGDCRHLGFLTIQIFRCRDGQEVRNASFNRISSKSVKRRARYGYF